MKKIGQKISSGLRKTLIGLMIASSLGVGTPIKSLGTETPKAPITGVVQGIISQDKGQSYLRPMAFYQLPKEIKGFSFAELYSGGYLARTTLSRDLGKGFGPIVRAGKVSGFETKLDLGASYQKSIGKLKMQVYVLPLTLTKTELKEGIVAGYSVSSTLPKGFGVSSLGEVSFTSTGPSWIYGEVSLEKKISDRLSVSYIPALKNSGEGKLKPKIEHRASLDLKF